jgi:hypothetical protein
MLKNNMPSFFNPKMGGGGIPNFMMSFFVMEIYHLIHRKRVPKVDFYNDFLIYIITFVLYNNQTVEETMFIKLWGI